MSGRSEPLLVERIVSGGQTGADRAALDVALELGLARGGWVPRGRRAEDGPIPQRYEGMVETVSDRHAQRTELNVRDSDATLVLTLGPVAGGTALTVDLARRMGRPLLVLDLAEQPAGEAVAALRRWLASVRPRTLNVAGPRASEAPGIGRACAGTLRAALTDP